MSTTGHETEAINVQGLKASLKKGGNIGIFNEAICSTAGSTAAKVTNTTPPSFTLSAGAKILVKFTYAISAENSTLQVGSNTAKPIYYKGAALPANLVKAGTSVLLAYDGTSYNIVGDLNTDTTYSTMGASGSTHAGGLVPDTPSTAGTTKFLREDGSWQEPSGSIPSQTGNNGKFLTTNGSAASWASIPSDSTKADKLPMTGAGAATENNFVAIDANGNIKDSGKSANSFQLKVEVVNITLKTYVGGTPSALIGATVIIKNTANSETIFSTTWNGSEITVDIPVGITYEIETGAVANYATPNKVGFTSYSGNVRNVSFLYDDADSVDLGLPSGLKWCTHNVGASTPEGTGSYFTWGNTVPRTEGTPADYENTQGYNLTGDIPSNSVFDAACNIMKYPWRMPTRIEQIELLENCNFTWDSVNGVSGARLTSKINGKSIFLPAGGRMLGDGTMDSLSCYWSSSCETSILSFCFNFNNSGISMNDWHKSYGFPIRPVK